MPVRAAPVTFNCFVFIKTQQESSECRVICFTGTWLHRHIQNKNAEAVRGKEEVCRARTRTETVFITVSDLEPLHNSIQWWLVTFTIIQLPCWTHFHPDFTTHTKCFGFFWPAAVLCVRDPVWPCPRSPWQLCPEGTTDSDWLEPMSHSWGLK